MGTKYLSVITPNSLFSYRKDNDKMELDVGICIITNSDGSVGYSTKQDEFHAHATYEGHAILRGECEFELSDGEKITVSEGQFIIFPENKRHRINHETASFSKMLITFVLKPKNTDDTEFYEVMQTQLQKTQKYKINSNIKFLIEKLMENATEKGHDYINLISSYVYSYIIETARVVVGNKLAPKRQQYSDTRIEKALKYIDDNININITTEDVAKYVFMSSRQLTRIFQKFLEHTPSDYIRMSKINFACKLLSDTKMSISEISEQLGFCEVTAFINFFKRYEGITPAKYRKTF